jgi:peptide/nickel transport system permease protein
LSAVAVELPVRRRGALVLDRLARQPVTVAAIVALLAILLVGVLATHIAPYQWDEINLTDTNHAPQLAGTHLFGTDHIGRDVFSRTLYGLRTTEEIGLAAAGLATIVGLLLGAIAGFYPGWPDIALMRVVDVVTTYPAILLTLAAIVFFRPVWPHTLIFILGLYLATFVARVVRGSVAATRVHDYVDAARALGATDRRIFFRHLLPNVSGTVVVAATSVLGQAILLDATIEFFSYGMPASTWPSLGNLLADVTNSGGLGLSDYRILGWWTWVFPAAVLAVLLVCVNLVGDGLDAALDPASQRR